MLGAAGFRPFIAQVIPAMAATPTMIKATRRRVRRRLTSSPRGMSMIHLSLRHFSSQLERARKSLILKIGLGGRNEPSPEGVSAFGIALYACYVAVTPRSDGVPPEPAASAASSLWLAAI